MLSLWEIYTIWVRTLIAMYNLTQGHVQYIISSRTLKCGDNRTGKVIMALGLYVGLPVYVWLMYACMNLCMHARMHLWFCMYACMHSYITTYTYTHPQPYRCIHTLIRHYFILCNNVPHCAGFLKILRTRDKWFKMFHGP